MRVLEEDHENGESLWWRAPILTARYSRFVNGDTEASLTTYLHRPADRSGRLLAGLSETDVARGFLTSAEYAALHLNAASFVQALYTKVLGRQADPTGLAVGSVLALFPGGREEVADAVLSSPEEQRRLVDSYYASTLAFLGSFFATPQTFIGGLFVAGG